MKKPRLLKRCGLWYCAFTRSGGVCGIGYTPALAYADWKHCMGAL